MKVTKLLENDCLILEVSGRIDTITAPELENEFDAVLSGIRELIFDFSEVDYVSSAGLRVILLAQKKMASRGSMKLIHVAPEVMEVFEMTGFDAILSIE